VDLMLAGKRALVTGASKGIGLAVARALAEEGCDLVLVARNPTALEVAAKSLVENFGRDVRVIPADLAQGEGIDAVATAVDSLDVLINNAGAIPPGDLHAMDNDAWRKAWDLKLFGYVGLTRALWEKLKTRGGVVVNIIGSAGERFEPDYLAGTSANAALMAFTRALGKTAPREGMRVVGVNPGPVSTERGEVHARQSGAGARRSGTLAGNVQQHGVRSSCVSGGDRRRRRIPGVTPVCLYVRHDSHDRRSRADVKSRQRAACQTCAVCSLSTQRYSDSRRCSSRRASGLRLQRRMTTPRGACTPMRAC
jgi:short-subunit dehydrogenase